MGGAPVSPYFTIMTDTFRHRTPIQIRFNDLDAYRHVNNNVYFSFYDLGKESYFADVLHSEFSVQRVVPIVASISADFIEPIFYGDEIVIETRVSHLGTKSFTLQQRAVNEKNGRVVCQAQTVMVCVNVQTQQTSEIPEEYRASIEAYEAIED